MSRFPEAALIALLAAAPAMAGPLGLGRPAEPDEVAAWDIDVRPDGLGLPEGSGDVETGEMIFTDNCAVCHGDFGEAVGRWPVLAGGQGSLTHDRPEKTIGSYWPYLSTVFDYVHRAMPFGNAQSLSADDVYSITAYLLYLNDIVEDDFELSKENFTEVRLPNEDNFYMDDRAETELAEFSPAEVCMEGCKASVEITAHATVIDVTPEGDGGGIDLEGGGTPAAAAPAAEEAALETSEPEPPVEEVTVAVVAVDPALAEAGAKVFKKCQACHAVGEGAKNKTGPELNGLFGRTAGTVEGFTYSKPMQAAGAAGLVWSEADLAQFLTKPRDYIKGTKMTFVGLKKDEDVAAVTEYLKTFSN